ncbi:RES domain-containing protein, partial [uncultured Methylibium sp.]|uniref:RES domain-containing protein n=1 Tax=uncultured Methylibium sp. TaxID=381093 RepID=UPI0025D7C663
MPPPDVPARIIPAGELLQHVSRAAYRGTALHFGRSGGNRYDDLALRFGTVYIAFDLATALMESVFRQHGWNRRARRVITRTEVYARMVRAIGVLEPLSLADLTAPGVMASQFGLNLSQ